MQVIRLSKNKCSSVRGAMPVHVVRSMSFPAAVNCLSMCHGVVRRTGSRVGVYVPPGGRGTVR